MATRSPKLVGVTLANADVQIPGNMDHRPCQAVRQGCSSLSLRDLNWRQHATEPNTGIEFPMILNKVLPEESNSKFASEVKFLFFFGEKIR